MMWWFNRPKILIDSRESLAFAAETLGVLPFFPNNIKGLSIEEMCAPGMLFGGNYDEGCWEWKGPVIRKRTTAYGKFFRRKAGFVSLDVLPDFLNYRRKTYPIKSGSTEETLYEIIRENDSLTSTELKKLIFGSGKRTRWDELPESDSQCELINLQSPTKSKSLESPLQRLQMGGWIVINDFEYKHTKRGERYGWGVARYSTPELNFQGIEIPIDQSAEDSFDKMIRLIKKKWPPATSNQLKILLK